MAKKKPTEKTPHQRSVLSKPTRQERRRAARDDARAKQTVATASPLTVATSYSRQDVLAFVVLGLLVLVSYLPAMLWGGFVWDDWIITNSDPVRKVSGLGQIWFSPSAIEKEGHYWPLVYTTFWLEHKLWGFNPTGYHIVNVLLHLANTLLLWHLLRRLAAPGAWVVAAVFAVHPLHVESVAWVIERKDVLSGLFYFAAVLAWMRFVEQPNPRWYGWSLVLYAAGLLSKSIVVTLPAVLLIWHWWKQGRVTSNDLSRVVPFFVVGLVITVGDLSFYRSVGGSGSIDYSLAERMLIAARALWFYAGKLLWPSELAVIYPRWDIRVADPLAWGYLVAASALAIALWHFRHQLGRGPLAGALFFAVTLSPTLGFVGYSYMNYAFVADRFQYLAGIGVMAIAIGAVTYGVRRLSGLWQKGTLGVAAVVLVVLGMLTWRQASIYRDAETFYRHIIALNPQARNAHRHLGMTLYNQERYEEALDPARVAVDQRPGYFKTHITLGKVLSALDRFEEAETHLRRVIALNPDAHSAHYFLGDVLYKQGRYEEALGPAHIAVDQRPDSFAPHVNLGAILSALDRFEEAETHLRRAIALNPEAHSAYLNLGDILYQQGRYEEALDVAHAAVDQRPDSFEPHVNLGITLSELARFEEAETHLRRAIALNPEAQDAHRHLGDILFKQGRYEEALEATRVVVAQDPDSFDAHVHLGTILNVLGYFEEAEIHLRRAIALNPQVHGVHLNLSNTLYQQGRYGEALDAARVAVQQRPDIASMHTGLGVVFAALERYDEALQCFDQALSLDPSLEDVRANREAVLEAMEGNVE